MAANDAELKITATLDDQATKAVEKLASEVQELGEKAKKSFDGIGTPIKEVGDSLDRAADSAKKAKTEMKGAAEEGSRGFEKLKDKLGQTVVSMLGVTTAIGIFVKSVKEAIETAKELEIIRKRLQNASGATSESLELLANDLKALSLVNKDFVEQQEVSQSALLLLREGFSATSTVVYDIAEAIDFARVNGVTLTEATKLLVEAQKSLGDETKNSTLLFTRLNLLFANGFDDAGQLASALEALANTARQSGLSLDDATVSLATLSEQTKSSEALKNLETILKTLQSRTADVDAIFNQAGKSFDKTTVSSAGLRNTLVALLEGIAAGGGDAQEELKKLFGSQEAVNSILQLAAKDGDVYAQKVKELSKSLKTLNAQESKARESSQSLLNVYESYGDVVQNFEGGLVSLDGTVTKLYENLDQFRRANADAAVGVQISAGQVSDGVKQIRTAVETFGPATGFAEGLASSIKKVGEATKVSQSSIDEWFSRVSGEEVDADLKRINDEIKRLTDQAYEFSKAGVEGFDEEGLKFRLKEVFDFEQLLMDELATKRKLNTEESTKDKKKSAEESAKDEADRILELKLLQQQVDKEEFDRKIQQAKEIQQLTQQLVAAATAGDSSPFFASIEAQARDLGAEIFKLQNKIAAEVLPEEELNATLARIELLKAGIQQLTKVSVQSSEALGKGFSETLNQRITETLDNFQTGVKLANAAFDSFANSLSSALTAIVTGSKSASDAFKDFLRSFLAGLLQAINQAIAFRIAAAFFTAGTSVASPGLDVGAAASQAGDVQIAAKGGVVAGSMGRPAGLPVNAYAQGGVARSPQVAVFGEGKGAEAFVPLPGPNRGIPVEFKSMPSGGNITINYSPSIQALDGASTREVLVREARVIGDIIASEISTGSNRGLTDVVRGRSSRA